MGIKLKSKLGVAFKILLGIVYTIPIWLAFVFSIHPNADFTKTPLHIIPNAPTLENFVLVFQDLPFLSYYKNTLVMLAICIPCQIVLSCLAAYAFTYYSFKFRDTLFMIYLTAMMIPGEVTLVVNYATIVKLDLLNSYIGICITSLVGVGSIFMLRQNMLSIPKELFEAAVMDGCGKVRYLFKVVIPLSTSVITAMVISSFIGIYNAYLWPLMVSTKDEYHTLQVGMAQLINETGGRYGIVMAGAVVSMFIPMLVFFFGQKYIIQGMAAGAVKS